MHAQKHLISGSKVQSEVLAIARSLGNDLFKASTGWFDSFKKRHNIAWNGAVKPT
jgi:hypothetical protein